MIFLDNASTTCLSQIAKNEIKKSQDLFYNPSAVYNVGLEIKNKIDDAKKQICKAMGVIYNDNLIITGSATEANNLAIFGTIKKTQEQLIFSIGEHPSVYNCALELKARGYNVNFVSLDESGKVNIEELKELLNKPTAFISIMHVNNETGAINDIAKISKLIKQKNPNAIFHCDGVQAFGKIKINLNILGVDLYTISAHKIHGPKGIGALYVKNIKKLKPILFGGGQEIGIRPGTENVLYILTFGQIAQNFNIENNFKKVEKLNKFVKNFFEKACKKDNLSITLNSPEDSSPYIMSYSFEGVRGETLVHILEGKNVIIGTGSACSSKKGMVNRILEAMGKSKSQNQGAVRISFSHKNNLKEIKEACDKILQSYKELLNKIS
jgi:cysteine desulfurase